MSVFTLLFDDSICTIAAWHVTYRVAMDRNKSQLLNFFSSTFTRHCPSLSVCRFYMKLGS
jgi:hypothetical protein